MRDRRFSTTRASLFVGCLLCGIASFLGCEGAQESDDSDAALTVRGLADLPREPVPIAPTLIRLTNDTESSVLLLSGCNGEDWLAVQSKDDEVPSGACACAERLEDGSCPRREPVSTCQAFWNDELLPGASIEREVRYGKRTYFDELGCYVREGLSEGVVLEYQLALPPVGDVVRDVPYGTEVIEVKVSEAR